MPVFGPTNEHNMQLHALDGGAFRFSAVRPEDFGAMDLKRKVKRDEYLESLLAILIGVNADDCSDWLDEFHKEAGKILLKNLTLF